MLYKSTKVVEPRSINSKFLNTADASDESSSDSSSEDREEGRKDRLIIKLREKNDKLTKKVKQLLLYIDYLQELNKPKEIATRSCQTVKKWNDENEQKEEVKEKENELKGFDISKGYPRIVGGVAANGQSSNPEIENLKLIIEIMKKEHEDNNK